MKSPPNGIAGAAISLIAIFLPGILVLMGALPFWETFRRRSDAQAIMRASTRRWSASSVPRSITRSGRVR